MACLAKTLTAVLVFAFAPAVCGMNACLTPSSCGFALVYGLFSSCGLTDDDLPDLQTCFDSIGRFNIHGLELGDNLLTTIPGDLFDGMTTLFLVDLADNAITTIEAAAFQPVKATLGYLELQGNALTSLRVDDFGDMPNILVMNFANNQLTTLPDGIFDGLGSGLRFLFLQGNDGLQCIPTFTASMETTSSSSTYADTDLQDEEAPTTPGLCECTSVATCDAGFTCNSGANGYTCDACNDGTDMCDDPHMKGLRGQKIDWSGVDGGWYCIIKDDVDDLHINVRLTAPLPEEFPDRQLITGLSILSEGHSLAVEVKNPYDIDTTDCPRGMPPCLANGGLRAVVDGEEVDDLLHSTRNEYAADGIAVSAANLPVECRQFGGDKIWARMYEEMLQGRRELSEEKEAFEDWVQRFDAMAAPEWCKLYIAQHGLAEVQSNHAVFKIMTSSVTVRLNVGTNYQGGGELDWDGRVLPDLEFWQMDVGVQGLSLENELLSGILGETARPVLDESGHNIMEGYEAFRGSVEDYRVSGPLGTDFALLENH